MVYKFPINIKTNVSTSSKNKTQEVKMVTTKRKTKMLVLYFHTRINLYIEYLKLQQLTNFILVSTPKVWNCKIVIPIWIDWRCNSFTIAKSKTWFWNLNYYFIMQRFLFSTFELTETTRDETKAIWRPCYDLKSRLVSSHLACLLFSEQTSRHHNFRFDQVRQFALTLND